MATGTVTWVDARKGYGFIAGGEGGTDLFVDLSNGGGEEPLVLGSRVDFERREGMRGHLVARNVVLCVPELGDGGRVREEPGSAASR